MFTAQPEEIKHKTIVLHAYGGPEVLKVEDYPDPIPGPGEVLL
jgi:NADPH:quinone reductase-like Zn-dependent oxidoreductase